MNPGNLFLCEDGRVKLGGLEQYMGVQLFQSKDNNELYDAHEISKEGDMRSLGVSLMEILKGEEFFATFDREDVDALIRGMQIAEQLRTF